MNRKSGLYRLTLLVMVLAFLGGVGYVAYRFLTPAVDVAAEYQKSAEQANDEGKQSLDAKDGEKAKNSFNSADVLTKKALEAMQEEEKKPKTAEQNRKLLDQNAKLLWLKAQILLNTALANAIVDGKPIAPVVDSITQEQIYTIGQLTDDKVRQEAAYCTLMAAHYLKKDKVIQNEALRIVSGEPYDWAKIEEFAKNVLEIEPENVRAHWLLAQFEFKQPIEGTNKLTDEKSLRRERVEAAHDHLDRVKAAPVFPLWRTLNLETDINLWLAKHSPPKDNRDDERLQTALFDVQTGALARAGRQENFKTLNKEDLRGIIELHFKALKIARERARKPMAGQYDDIFYTLNSLTHVMDILSKNEYGKPYRAEMLFHLMEPAYVARPSLGNAPPPQWVEIRDNLENAARDAVEAHVNSPRAYAVLARILNQDAILEGKNKKLDVKEELEKRALKWVNDGLRLAAEAKQQAGAAPADRVGLIELHGAALEVLIAGKKNAEALKPHFAALKEMHDAQADALVDIQEAIVFIRQDKLTQAQVALEKVTKNIKGKEMKRLASILLAHIYLTNDQPLEASVHLRDLEKEYGNFEDISTSERGWLLEFLADPKDLAMLTVYAELETAIKKIITHTEHKSGEPFRTEILQPHEEAAWRAINKLTALTDANRRARVYYIGYLLRTHQYEKATDMLKLLKADYPRHVDVLRLEVLWAIQPESPDMKNDAKSAEARIEKADALIKGFVAKNPDDLAAKRYWAEWLIRTNRYDMALAYLKDPANFPKGQDEGTKRLLALVSSSRGDQAQTMQLLQQSPNDDFLNLILIAATTNPIELEKKLQEAVAKHENSGLIRLALAEFLLANNKPEQADRAAQAFWKTFDFTRVGTQARIGFVRAVQTLADVDPDKALQLIEQLSKETPDEPVLYSSAAYAAIKKGDFGKADDVWERSKSMYAALGRWQNLAQNKHGLGPTSVNLFKAQLWLIANRPDIAWTELSRAEMDLRNEAVLTQLINIAIDSGDDEKITMAMNYLALLKEIKRSETNPNLVPVMLLEAGLFQSQGGEKNAQKSIDILEGILKQQPNQFEVYPLLIQALNDRGQFERSAFWTKKWREKQPDNPLPIMEQIRQDIMAGRLDQAKAKCADHINETVKRAEKDIGPVNGPDAENAKRARLKEIRCVALIAVAQTWYKSGKLDEAEKFVNECLKDDPKNAQARMLLSYMAIDRKDWEKVRAINQEILNDDKNNIVAEMNLAWVLAEHLDQPDEGLRMLKLKLIGPFSKQPVAIESVTSDFLNVLGQVYEQAARKRNSLRSEMEKNFEPASKRYSSDPRMFLYLGDAQAGTDNKEKARSTYRTAIELANHGKGPFTQEQRQQFIQKVNDRLKGL